MKKSFTIILSVQLCCAVMMPAGSFGFNNAIKPLVVNIADYGIVPDSRINVTPVIRAILEKYGDGGKAVKIIFPKGRYDFWQNHSIEKTYFESNTEDNNPKNCAIFMYGKKNLTIDGLGSTFIFHGKMQPFTVDSSENVAIRNVTIDWDIPLTAQGEVMAVTQHYIDLRIDTHESPYEIVGGKVFFTGEGWKSRWGGVMEFDRETGNVAPGSGDHCLGKGWDNYEAVNVATGIIRLKYDFLRKPAVGNYLILRHSARDHAGIFVVHSNKIFLENIEIFYAAGLGILSQYSGDISFKNIKVIPNKAKKRYFSGHDDGLHISNCKGQIVVDSCVFEGLMDDPINVHGTAVRIIGRKDSHRLVCRFMHPASKGFRWAVPKDKVGFIDHHSMQPLGSGLVKEFKPLNVDTFEITFSGAVPTSLKTGDALENLTWTPDVVIRNCLFGGSNRARGLLVTTPGKVVIEDNVFNSSGSAILIAGDANYWYESGAVKDVTIRGNIFKAGCLTSLYQFCEAIISIDPEIPGLKPGLPAFHRNISITGNIFHPFDYPVLYAKSVDGLEFSDNTLIRSHVYKPFHTRKAGITLNACYHVEIHGNKFTGNVLGTSIAHKNMPDVKIKLLPGSCFRLE